jgi:hypothetical protein
MALTYDDLKNIPKEELDQRLLKRINSKYKKPNPPDIFRDLSYTHNQEEEDATNKKLLTIIEDLQEFVKDSINRGAQVLPESEFLYEYEMKDLSLAGPKEKTGRVDITFKIKLFDPTII